jgi:hypothetical protein
MKTQFKITGLYYEIQGYKFRKYLDVQKKNSSQKSPQLICLLMNPGGSKPIDGVDDNTVESEAIPDRTQSQIMKVMLNAGFEYARVLNLSDVREPKSNVFYKKMAELDTKGIAHSIFDDSRKEDLSQLWVNNITVIYGWGVSSKLKPLALKAIAACNVSNPYGILKANTNWAYYHPLVPIHSKQLEWIKQVSEQFKD